jgi:hypothetical protein
MGPVAAKSYPGPTLVRPAAEQGAPRAKQAIDDGRRGKGSLFGGLLPATGAALTMAAEGRPLANGVDCLEQTERWGDPAATQVSAMLDNVAMPRAVDGWRFARAPPRWTFGCPPQYAADLHVIAPWWKTLRSIALKGKRFARWEEVSGAVDAATTSGNAHRHPFCWGNRRHHQPRRKAGIGRLPLITGT